MNERPEYVAWKPVTLRALTWCATLVWILILPGFIHVSFGQESPSPSREKGGNQSPTHDRKPVSRSGDTAGEPGVSGPGLTDEEEVQPRPLIKQFGAQPLTPEEQEEANRLSTIAARQGNDPTAIIGRAQTLFRYDALEGGSRTNNLVARLDVPYHHNFLLRAELPYQWSNPNQPGTSYQSGVSDLFLRAGARVYAVPGDAIFAGMDFTFPTAEHNQLGTGKYTIGPGVATAHVFPGLDSLIFTLLQHQVSVGGDPSRKDVSVSRMQVNFNTIWTHQWWTQLEAVTQVNWERKATNSLTLEFEGGKRFTQDWGLWVRPGVGLWGRNIPGAYEWNIEAGVRRMFEGF